MTYEPVHEIPVLVTEAHTHASFKRLLWSIQKDERFMFVLSLFVYVRKNAQNIFTPPPLWSLMLFF